MKKLFLILLFPFSFFLSPLKAQNLVYNPSFEIYDSCPNNTGCQIQYATGWSIYRTCIDYLNSCANSSSYGVPYNSAGFQYAATGNAYGGGYFYFPAGGIEDKEDVGTTLLSPLAKGTKYYVSFKVSLCSIDSNLGTNAAVNKIGALFSTVQYSFNCPAPINNYAQVYTNTIISDTLNWTTISGSFIADSVYKYLAIGNFFTDANISKMVFFKSNDTLAYYYIDDICVSTDSNYCANWTGISTINATENDNFVYPNPSNGSFTIEYQLNQGDIGKVCLYNTLGEKVGEYMLNQSEGKMNITNYSLSNGVYIYQLYDNDNIVKFGKIVIMK